MHDKCDGYCQTFMAGACVGLQVFDGLRMLHVCENHQSCDCYACSFVQ